jgi:hypothetical protein
MHSKLQLLATGCVLSLVTTLSQADLAGYLDKLRGITGSGTTATQPAAGAASNAEMIAGLKEALGKGTRFAVDQLGKDGGFLDNTRVRIPMPASLARIERGLRVLHQDRLADDFIASMNHAAERAVPEAAPIFRDAIQAMTLDDAKQILTGPDDAATQYFRQHTATALTDKMRPIVAAATAQVGVTASYKKMMSKVGGLGSLLGDSTDIDGYVTAKTLDGLFLMVAEEERRIRTNPVARTTELLKKVFGNAGP